MKIYFQGFVFENDGIYCFFLKALSASVSGVKIRYEFIPVEVKTFTPSLFLRLCSRIPIGM